MLNRLKTKAERKLAGRLLLADLRAAKKRGIWSDGNTIYRGEEIAELAKRLTTRLVNDDKEKRKPIERFTNVMSTLGSIRKRPEIHGLPTDIKALFAERSRQVMAGALRQTPGSADHFILSRRLGRKVGSIGKTEMPFGPEIDYLTARLRYAESVVVTKPGGNALAAEGAKMIRIDADTWANSVGQTEQLSDRQLLGGVKPVRLSRKHRELRDKIRSEITASYSDWA